MYRDVVECTYCLELAPRALEHWDGNGWRCNDCLAKMRPDEKLTCVNCGNAGKQSSVKGSDGQHITLCTLCEALYSK